MTMAEMGLGYGSEYQLLRFLGHHRNVFFKMIREAINTDCEIEWLDYPMDPTRASLDGELEGIKCFESLTNYAQIKDAWSDFWANKGGTLNWDGVFKCGDEWFLVEAKAHSKEFFSKCRAAELCIDGKENQGRNKIARALSDTANWLGSNNANWIDGEYYQLANRLAFIYFCHKQNIKVKLLYVDFINGYDDKNGNNFSIKDTKSWEMLWSNAYDALGLSGAESQEKLEGIVYRVYPNCLPE